MDYVCLVYGSAAKRLLNHLDKTQYQVLRLCFGAIKMFQLQVEMNELLLEIRRHQL